MFLTGMRAPRRFFGALRLARPGNDTSVQSIAAFQLHMPISMSSTPRRSAAPAAAPLSHRASTPASAPAKSSASPSTPSLLKGRFFGKPSAPVAFGTFEVGRSSMPNNVMPTAAFRDSMRRDIIFADMAGCARVESGDPGAYDPFTGADLSHRVSFSHNKMHRPFGSLSSRELQLLSPGVGVPGPGSYRVGEAKMALIAEINDNRSAFKSGSAQRPPPAITSTPGPNFYSPDLRSIEPNLRDSGATMRSVGDRFRRMDHPDSTISQSMTDASIGPGSYNSHEHGSIALLTKRSLARSSKLRPAFGTVCAQRALPYSVRDNIPGPGSYQPEIWTGAPLKGSQSARSQSAPRSSRRKSSEVQA